MRGGAIRSVVGVAALALLLVACGGGPREFEGPPPVPVSPNGEPLVGHEPGPAGCEAAQAAWLAAADQNRDGVLARAEVLADAQPRVPTGHEKKDAPMPPDETHPRT